MTDARKWLGRARSINREIESLLDEVTEARAQLLRITQNYNSDGAQSTKDPHGKYERLLDYELRINQKVDELVCVKEEIMDAISNLRDGRHRCVLWDYYIRGKSLEEIAVKMHYSYRQIKRFHRQAAADVQRMLTEEENDGNLERPAREA